MSRCFIWFPFGGLGKLKLYHDLGVFYKNRGYNLEGVWLWRISGGYSQEMMGFGFSWGYCSIPFPINIFPSMFPLFS